MSRLLYIFLSLVLGAFVFTAVYLLKNPGQRDHLLEFANSKDGGEVSTSRTSKSREFSSDTNTRNPNANILNDDSRLETVLAETGSSSRYRQLARGVVRVDLKFESTDEDGTYTDDTCTGFIIDTTHIATARHCLVSETNDVSRLVNARVVLDYLIDTPGQSKFVTLNTEPSSITTGPDGNDENDYAILEIIKSDQQMIEADRILELSFENDIAGENLFILHHPYERPLHLSQAGCFSEDSSTPKIIAHTCSTYPGSSGAPIFNDRTSRVVAIHTSSKGDDDMKGVILSSLSEAFSTLADSSAAPSSSIDNVEETEKEILPMAIDTSGAPDWDEIEEKQTDSEIVTDVAPFIPDAVE